MKKIAVSIDVGHRLSISGITEQFNRIGNDGFIGIRITGTSGRGDGLAEVLETRFRFVLDDLVDVIND